MLVGLKRRVRTQLPPADTFEGQLDVSEKSPLFVPVIESPVIISAEFPELLNVTVSGELEVPTACEGNVRTVAESCARAAGGSVPSPESEIE